MTFGRVYKYYSAKWLLIALVAIFEIGSIVCATAPSSHALIVGRVITGIGGAGTTSGALLLITFLVPLQARPKWTGGIGAVFGLASILGPVVGGYLTSVTWRWCFWLNVPIGAVSLVLLTFLCPDRAPPSKRGATWKERILQLDPLGFALLAPSVVCLLFALQLGGVKLAWNSGAIIALFVVFAVFAVAFIAAQIWRGDNATVPPRILRQRSMLAGALANTGIGSLLVLYSFYLPIWFQVIQGKSPQASGLSLLGFLLSNVFAVIIGGILTSKIGYFTPFMMAGGALIIVGSGLVTTWQPTTGAGKWIGFQIVLGAGLGLTLQQPNLAAQTVLSRADVSIGLSVLQFVNFLGGTIFVSVSQTLLEGKLVSGLRGLIPNLSTSQVAGGGATSLRGLVSAEQLLLLLDIYNDSIRNIWYVALALACVIFLASFVMEWRSVKEDPKAGSQDPEKA